MGIHNLTNLIKHKSPNAIQTTALYTLKNKKVAIDISIFLYKSLANIRSNGDYIRNKDNKVISHIIGILNKTLTYLSFGIEPIYIFDGKPPEEKSNVLIERNKKANNSKLLSEQSLTQEEKNKHEKNSIRVKKHHIDDIKLLLNKLGISYIHPDGEAEAYAAELCRIGYVDYVVSEDMDTLAFGCPKMIRTCLDKTIKRSDVISVISLDQILNDFNMNINNFVDMCILCGCDYCTTIPKVGSVRSFNYIKSYQSIDKLIESKKCVVPQDFIDKYKIARELFDIFKNKIDKDNIELIKSEYNKEHFEEYLLKECSYNTNKVKTILTKIDKFDN